jgi:hypothetical protein
MTKEQQAIKVIKEVIDSSIQAGVIKNIETANLVYNSYQILNDSLYIRPKKEDLPKEKNTNGTSNSNTGS